ncbi:rhodanese-related sulfurtransferase [Frigoribacterium sp. ACAM 257]|uniref:oxygen-dependent tRNA uridine(34) hydroxylase TrhO n=1 Tax=Frigoribacterium sp. ACAM 257 TaxID=2508998 RepID=UPI0011B98D28|nr:rhodanese-related sulfurtransferase [Frigoribacterium sp. ACAM 257]TWX38365.1 rhodanese-related sulfurtransferase [Frigoribacterium sp. ACAM 257]
MPVSKIVLFYAFAPLADPDALRLWQRDLAESLGLRGRVLLSPHGVNGTLGGDVEQLRRWVRKTKDYRAFSDLDVKWSDGGADDFPRLSVKVRDEIVTFGAVDELEVDESGVVGGGARLSPDELHELVAREDVVFLDGRNEFEARIGRCRDAVVPDVSTTREFVAELDSGRWDHLKERTIVTYCTGGVRCEVLSSLMVSRGFGRVHQLDGGVARYGERFGDDGLWEGSLYVFDRRGSVRFSDHAAVVGRCATCGEGTSRMQNCSDLQCREQLVVCASCADRDVVLCDAHRASGDRPPLRTSGVPSPA